MHRGTRAAVIILISAVLFTGWRLPAQVFITNLHRIVVSENRSLSVKTNAPIGQSFIAVTNAIGWVEFLLDDADWTNGLPAVSHVNLRTYVEAQKTDPNPGAVSGELLCSSYPTTITNGHRTFFYTNPTRFIFPTNVSLVAGTKYWWEFVSDSGDDVFAHFYHLGFPDGDVISGGTNFGGPSSTWDMEYNEGTIAKYPEFKAPRIEQETFLTRTPNGATPPMFDFLANLEGMTGQQYVVEISSNLVTWTPFRTNTFDTSPRSVGYSRATDPDTPPRLFFRARYLNPQ
jgi:hypothetical protein